MDRRYLACIAENYGGGPVGVDTLAAALSEQRDVIEDVIEPYLMQLGLLMRTPRGRLLSEGGLPPSRRGDAAASRSGSSTCWPPAGRRRRRDRGADVRPSRRRRPCAAVADLLRGHRRGRHRLLRQLAALPGARTHRAAAPARPGAQRAARRARHQLGRAPLHDRLPEARPAGRRRSRSSRAAASCAVRRWTCSSRPAAARRPWSAPSSLVACMGDGGRPVRLPPHVRAALAQVTAAAASPRSRHIRV